MNRRDLIAKAYQLFNERKVEDLLLLMTADVHWSNGWEGGYVNGREEVKEYWTRQWKEINPTVIPEKFTELNDERMEVLVRQVVADLQGNILMNGFVRHVYTFENDLVSEMQILPID
jgi:nuclear transport factor 2 (NTF2) superfamily protein